jgi:putative transposase
MKDRRPQRLNTHNYSTAGMYFVTINVLNNKCCFGYIRNGEMIFNEYGKTALEQIKWLMEHYSFVNIDKYVIMPNHVHAIIEIIPLKSNISLLNLSQIVGAFKTRVSASIRKQGLLSFSWQRSFHDHIIRNLRSYENIAAYIESNPLNWEKDRFHVINTQNL